MNLPDSPEPAGRLARALLTAVRSFVYEASEAGDSPETVRNDVLAELNELVEFFGIPPENAAVDSIRLAVSATVDRALADALAEEAAQPESSEEILSRLLNWLFDFTLRAARERLKAGCNVRDITAELIGEHPAKVAEIFGIPADNPARGDFERAVANLCENAVWFASRYPEPAA